MPGTSDNPLRLDPVPALSPQSRMRLPTLTVLWVAPVLTFAWCATCVELESQWGRPAGMAAVAACGLCVVSQIAAIALAPGHGRPLRLRLLSTFLLVAFTVVLDIVLSISFIVVVGLISLHLTGMEGIQ